MNHLQQQFLLKIEQLSNVLVYPQPTTGLLIKGIRSASLYWCGGQPFGEAEHDVYHRFNWRVKDDLAPDARLDEALRLLAGSIPLGMIIFSDLDAQLGDPAERGAASRFIDHLAVLGFELRLHASRYAAA